jgi:histidine triad (HIT) family protein
LDSQVETMPMNPNCIFCKIVAGQIPSKKAYEDDDVLAFHDINPAAPVHLLVIPKAHIASLADCEYGQNSGHEALLGKMNALAPKLAREAGSGSIAPEAGADGPGRGGFRTFISTGPDGGQEVYHLHMHVLAGPRPWKPR